MLSHGKRMLLLKEELFVKRILGRHKNGKITMQLTIIALIVINFISQ
jgi:hypothetical protein